MINIVIPMAGLGSRFSKVGYKEPKPFIDVDGKAMIVRVLENLAYENARYILIAREEHLKEKPNLVNYIKENFNVIFLPISHLTEGTACTVLYARKLINNNEPLLIANSDQIIDMDISKYIDDCRKRDLDGSILTFIDKDKNPKWSFAKINKDNFVVEVKEKVAISDIATVGIYLYQRGKDYIDATIDMFIENDRVSNEFYVCPTYNYAIKNRLKIGIYNISANKMHGIGTPADLNLYLEHLKKKGTRDV